ncbi:MAG: ribosome biogenesis GTP-binding protein YihA/YsxC [Flavobacteriales bacterium]|jgi:GTP-binding protein|nr:ribosome biogenesis GTP-binding protein YihA/YsxC [Flavobacteriaceae bacterium]MDO7582479.1 ribosome biogenesis GTP-binding protein YihA/YsxC [Flavobacteriaceae bacterium]MDO7591774.1 ribosome biogenesis GTP-binding protein YihA/YsxC [Flavobacteriaceae bacterium]MDO7599522.1 ribosome biogenesis GTP-binding protein YihA/YsxC [Flavobacteriaceae bacterium]MDO7602715.1 ribosome biogenesis GTP-binding protein YihA/YsxC [Flavobacteriaceae bacterium]|tara:strand:- start:100 stop:732 length:633 start_codon:yes stop_codon:yes gene_type:complete
MRITASEFIISNTDVSKCPNEKTPEYAFIGRSNVGKSSLINSICDRKNLAKTSGRPGKTQLINHFKINKSWYLVDLPGYGYARTSKTSKKAFQKLITTYFEKRKQLVSAFVLIDIRHDPQPIDLEFMEWLGTHYIPFSIIFTKADKEKPMAIKRKTETYIQKMLDHAWEEAPPHFITSSLHRTGGEELLAYIAKLNEEFINLDHLPSVDV